MQIQHHISAGSRAGKKMLKNLSLHRLYGRSRPLRSLLFVVFIHTEDPEVVEEAVFLAPGSEYCKFF